MISSRRLSLARYTDQQHKLLTFDQGTSGQLIAETEALIIDPLTGHEMSPTQEGELLLRGPQVLKSTIALFTTSLR
jgi:acyl-CoA synthetase (AMP-forming)/AMP-acid ligase II